MRTIKVLAIIGLAVALGAVPVLAAGAIAGGVATAGRAGATVDVFATIGAPAPQAARGDCKQNAVAAPPAPFQAKATCNLAPAAGLLASSELKAGFNPAVGVTIEGKAKTQGDEGELEVKVTWASKDIKNVKKDDTVTINVDEFKKAGRAEAKVALLKVVGEQIKEISDTVEVTGRGEIKLKVTVDAQADELRLRLTMNVGVVPTLTEWGLIALAVLLAGGMGYMIYRRRPALRPAAP